MPRPDPYTPTWFAERIPFMLAGLVAFCAIYGASKLIRWLFAR